ncbi:cytochrome b [Acuticoccus yangtzensis]|uniref:cytochrome b n=1 Tax=Acuticoccus yangtzensis TaxID=1443441 RepID=UPI0009498183|nr:cytochrome b/b6 domain-containing protein [Acuticoccus yangtzensis]
MTTTPAAGPPAHLHYGALARTFHWVSVLAVAFMLVTGLTMTWRGNDLGIWDGLTNGLYSSHKLVGFLILWLTLLRVLNRLIFGAPPPVPMPALQKAVAGLTHVALYGLLVLLPLLGWYAVSLFPARTVFGWFDLPALAAPDKVFYETVADWHATAAFVLMGVAGLHIAAAFYHLIVKRDGVFQRMWGGR